MYDRTGVLEPARESSLPIPPRAIILFFVCLFVFSRKKIKWTHMNWSRPNNKRNLNFLRRSTSKFHFGYYHSPSSNENYNEVWYGSDLIRNIMRLLEVPILLLLGRLLAGGCEDFLLAVGDHCQFVLFPKTTHAWCEQIIVFLSHEMFFYATAN